MASFNTKKFLKKLLGLPGDSLQHTTYADHTALHTDIHSHLIPGIDDGTKTMEESIAVIKELYQLGYKKIITTPHVMSDCYKNTPEIILNGLNKLKSAVKNAGIPVEVQAAAEYYLDESLESIIDKKQVLSFGDNYLLFELSLVSKPASLEGVVFKMNASGYKPVLAHVERYTYLYDKKLSQYKKLKELGVLFQLNIPSLTRAYTPLIRNIAHQLIDNKMIDFAGSDLHNERQLGYIKSAVHDKYFQRILNYPLLNTKI